jgi:hypothetical protein
MLAVRCSIEQKDINRSVTNEMRKVSIKTNLYLNDIGIPTPDRNLYFVKYEIISDIEKQLQAFKKSFFAFQEDLALKLYPVDKFIYDWTFRNFNLPKKNSVSSEIYKTEVEKLKKDIEIIKAQILSNIKTELSERITVLKYQIGHKEKKIHKATINSIIKILNKCEKTYSDFIDRKTLKSSLEYMREQFLNIDLENTKNIEFKDEIGTIVDNCTKRLQKDKLFKDIDL